MSYSVPDILTSKVLHAYIFDSANCTVLYTIQSVLKEINPCCGACVGFGIGAEWRWKVWIEMSTPRLPKLKTSPSVIFSYSIDPLWSVANGSETCDMFTLSISKWSSMLPDKVVSGYLDFLRTSSQDERAVWRNTLGRLVSRIVYRLIWTQDTMSTLAWNTSYTYIGYIFVYKRVMYGWKIRQWIGHLGLWAAFVVSRLQKHYKCGMQRLNNTEDEQQDNNHKGYA